MEDASDTEGVCESAPPRTLEDSIAEGLDVVFVGINPAIYSVERGHYFARRANKFWPCLSRSMLSHRAREALSVAVLGPEHDRAILEHGIGFTDVVKRPTAKASDLDRTELAAGVPLLLEKIRRYRPRIACFHGVTGYRYVSEAMGLESNRIPLGLQDIRIGETLIFLVPNPSGANAHFSRADQVFWYDQVSIRLREGTATPHARFLPAAADDITVVFPQRRQPDN